MAEWDFKEVLQEDDERKVRRAKALRDIRNSRTENNIQKNYRCSECNSAYLLKADESPKYPSKDSPLILECVSCGHKGPMRVEE